MPIVKKATTTTTTTTEDWTFDLHDGQVHHRLRHQQLRHSSSTGAVTSTSSEDNNNDNNNNNNSEERTGLLVVPSPSAPAGPAAAAAWTLSSPYMTLQSHHLLTVTYFPAYQNLPLYTKKTCGSNSCSSASSCCTTTSGRPSRDYMSHTYHVADIVKTESVVEHIDGVGSCPAIRVHLPPLLRMVDTKDDIPIQYQEQWNQYLQQIQQSRQARHVVMPSSSHRPTTTTTVLTFAWPGLQDAPLVWKVQVASMQHIALETLTVLEGTLIHPNTAAEPTHMYIHGWQSWSFAGSIPKGQAQPQPSLPNVFSKAFNYGGSVPPPSDTYYDNNDPQQQQTQPQNRTTPVDYCYTSDFFTCITTDGEVPPKKRLSSLLPRHHPQPQPYQSLDERGGPAVVLGWLSQRHQFGVIAADVHLHHVAMHVSCQGQWVLPGDVLDTDWGYAQLLSPHSYDEEPMVHYLHSVAAHNHARPLQNGSLLTGWCSWYFAYEQISASLLRQNVQQLAQMRHQVPTNVAVVDDGYMTAWGDWDSIKPKPFPSGMETVSRDIATNGMRPGLWLAPFAADKHSQLARDHPNWIIKNHAGAAANSSNCGKFFYGLDATNPKVRQHAYEAVHRAVHEWGFNVLKIDFLYAACLDGNGKFDLSMSRAEAMDLALQTIRDAAGPDTFLIGCGCPIATAIGLVDAMRISPDTGPTWYPAPPLPWWDMGTLPCLRSMVRNSISRACIGHRWWHNDPDCLMLGEHTRLTNDEMASAASIVAMTCGMLLLSDDLPKVPPQRMETLSKIFPMTGATAVALDLHSTNNGMPSLLRMWCTDKYNILDSLRHQLSFEGSDNDTDHNAEATLLGRGASFRFDQAPSAPDERKRSCIHVTKGLGTWTVVSISNWLDRSDVVHIPPPALLPPPTSGWDDADDSDDSMKDGETGRAWGVHGYHVFAFWSSRYSWLPAMHHNGDHGPEQTISKKLGPHATEIFHIKPVTPEEPQYIGSDMHFSCGQELRSFNPSRNGLTLRLKTDYKRVGHVFIFIPRVNTDNLRVTVHGKAARWTTIGNTPKVGDNGSPRLLGRVISIPVVLKASGEPKEGEIEIHF